MKFREAHSVANDAHELIQSVGDHSHLRAATILYLFTDSKPGPRAVGCRALGRVKVATSLDQYLFHWGTDDPGDTQDAMRGLEYRYALLIAESAWSVLSPARRRYLLDDLLGHCQLVENEVSGEEAYVVVNSHPHGGFAQVLERHGAEDGALDDVDGVLIRAAHQLPLPPERETIAQATMPEPDEDDDEDDDDRGGDDDQGDDDGPVLSDDQRSALVDLQARREEVGVAG